MGVEEELVVWENSTGLRTGNGLWDLTELGIGVIDGVGGHSGRGPN